MQLSVNTETSEEQYPPSLSLACDSTIHRQSNYLINDQIYRASHRCRTLVLRHFLEQSAESTDNSPDTIEKNIHPANELHAIQTLAEIPFYSEFRLSLIDIAAGLFGTKFKKNKIIDFSNNNTVNCRNNKKKGAGAADEEVVWQSNLYLRIGHLAAVYDIIVPAGAPCAANEKTANRIHKNNTNDESSAVINQQINLLQNSTGYDFYMVSSACDVQPQFFPDAAWKCLILKKCGIPVNRVYGLCINKNFIKTSASDYNELFNRTDITLSVSKSMNSARNTLSFLNRIRTGIINDQSKATTGAQKNYTLSEKYRSISAECAHCSRSECKYNVQNLQKNPQKNYSPDDLNAINYLSGWKNMHPVPDISHINTISDIPAEMALNSFQRAQVAAAQGNGRYIDRDYIHSFVNKLTFPISFLDFEAYQSPIPYVQKTKPYDRILFQYSLEIMNDFNSPIHHFEYIAGADEDPRETILYSLKKNLPDTGSIVVFNAVFEKQMLTELGVLFPRHKNWTNNAVTRIIDIWEPFGKGYYYDSRQRGKTSLKTLLPVLTDDCYQSLAIPDGLTAGRAYLLTLSGRSTEFNRKEIHDALYAYCGLDTAAMVHILRAFLQCISSNGVSNL